MSAGMNTDDDLEVLIRTEGDRVFVSVARNDEVVFQARPGGHPRVVKGVINGALRQFAALAWPGMVGDDGEDALRGGFQ
jgi:hypothetical protein